MASAREYIRSCGLWPRPDESHIISHRASHPLAAQHHRAQAIASLNSSSSQQLHLKASAMYSFLKAPLGWLPQAIHTTCREAVYEGSGTIACATSHRRGSATHRSTSHCLTRTLATAAACHHPTIAFEAPPTIDCASACHGSTERLASIHSLMVVSYHTHCNSGHVKERPRSTHMVRTHSRRRLLPLQTALAAGPRKPTRRCLPSTARSNRHGRGHRLYTK